MSYNYFSELLKRRKIMKQTYTEQQYAFIAKEKLYQLFQSVRSVISIDLQESTKTERYISDFSIKLHTQYEKIVLFVEVKSNGEKRFIVDFINRVQNAFINNNMLLVAPYFSEESMRFLKENKINFMDLSGNCCIAVGSIFISSEGQPNQYIIPRSNKNIFAKSSLASSKVLRTMLNEHWKEWQVQELALKTNISIGTVHNIKKYLAENNWCTITENKCFQLKDIEDLLITWSKYYNIKPQIVEEYYSFDSIAEFEGKVSTWNQNNLGQVLLGGFSAAARYAPTVRYNKAFVYVDLKDKLSFIQNLQLKKVEKGGNISIAVISDETINMFAREIHQTMVTSPVQTVLDLFAYANRGEEAAQAIIQKEYKNK